MSALKNFWGNVNNQKTEDNTWYISFIRNPNLSAEAKVVFLNLRTDNQSFNENIESLKFKCNISKNAVSKALKELEEAKLVKRTRKHIQGRYQWQYSTSIEPIQHIQNNGVENNGIVTSGYNNKKNININKVSKKEKTYSLSEDEKIENSIISFSDKKDEETIKEEFDNLLDGRLNIDIKSIDSLKDKSSIYRKTQRPLSEIIELIKLLPDFVKASKIKFPEKKYEDKQTLIYLHKILENKHGNYPKWFLDNQKLFKVQEEVNNLEQSWKPITSIWKAYGNRIDDSIKLMIETILNFISESEKYKKENKPDSNFLKITRKFFKESTQKTLKIKSIDEIIDLINEYSKKDWNNADKFKDVISNYFETNSLETIKLYFNEVI